MHVPTLVLGALLSLLALAAPRDLDAADLLAGLAGRWSGTLTYVDYSSGNSVEIPMRLRCESSEGGEYALQFMEFSDPGAVVRSLEVLVPRRGTKVVRTVSVGRGEVSTESLVIESREVRSARDWTLVCTAEGRDAGQPAAKRVTQTLRGDVLEVSTEYRPLDEPDAPWKQRNRVRLTRLRSAAEALAGTWRVDLRPTPDADAYYKEMVLSLQDGELEGRFYDTPFTGGAWNDDWGDVRFAFTTGDGTGAYHTSAVLRGDRIEGTTHSVGRGFLSVWTAVRAP